MKRSIEDVRVEYNKLIDDEEDREVELRGFCNYGERVGLAFFLELRAALGRRAHGSRSSMMTSRY